MDIVRPCTWCDKSYIYPWDWNHHNDFRHAFLGICKGYVADKEALITHNEEHDKEVMPCEGDIPQAASTPKQDKTDEPDNELETNKPDDPQAQETSVTTATDCQDCPVCRYCGREIDSQEALQKHILRHKVVPCPQCPKMFLKVKYRDQHINDLHKAPPSFHCRKFKCSRMAPSEIQLHTHMRHGHWDNFKYRCNKCPYVFQTCKVLSKHHKEKHSLRPLPEIKSRSHCKFPCGKCKCSFQDEMMFINHSRTTRKTSMSAKSVGDTLPH